MRRYVGLAVATALLIVETSATVNFVANVEAYGDSVEAKHQDDKSGQLRKGILDQTATTGTERSDDLGLNNDEKLEVESKQVHGQELKNTLAYNSEGDIGTKLTSVQVRVIDEGVRWNQDDDDLGDEKLLAIGKKYLSNENLLAETYPHHHKNEGLSNDEDAKMIEKYCKKITGADGDWYDCDQESTKFQDGTTPNAETAGDDDGFEEDYGAYPVEAYTDPPCEPTPAPGGPTPAPGGPTPAPGGPTPAPGGPTPAPGGPTPAPEGPTPAPGGPTPAPGGPTPAPGGPTPAPGGPTPAPGGPTPAPGGPTPAPGGPTPAPGGPTPAPGGPTPAPSQPHEPTTQPTPSPTKPHEPTSPTTTPNPTPARTATVLPSGTSTGTTGQGTTTSGRANPSVGSTTTTSGSTISGEKSATETTTKSGTDQTTTKSGGGATVSAGGIAGIAIGCALFVAIVVGVVLFRQKSLARQREENLFSGVGGGLETDYAAM